MWRRILIIWATAIVAALATAGNWQDTQQAKLLLLTALEEPEVAIRANLLVRAIDLDEENSDLPLGHLIKYLGDAKIAGEVSPRLEKLWQSKPSSLLRTLAVLRCAQALDYPPEKRREFLVALVTADFSALSSSDRALILPLAPVAFDTFLRLKEYSGGDALMRKIITDPDLGKDLSILSIVYCYCYWRDLRFDLASQGDCLLAASEKAALWERIVSLAQNCDTPRQVIDLVNRVWYLRILTPAMVKSFALPEEAQLETLALLAARHGEVAALEKVLAAAAEADVLESKALALRIKAAINHGDFDAAYKLISQEEDKNQQIVLLFELAIAAQKPDYADPRSITTPGGALGWIGVAESCNSREIYQRVVAAWPPEFWESSPEIANAVGYTAAVVGDDLELARRRIELALKGNPHSAAYLDSLAWVLFKQGKYSEAQNAINQALAQVVDLEEVVVLLNHAGDIEAALGNTDAAIWRYQQAVSITPETPAEKREVAAARAKLEKLGVKP